MYNWQPDPKIANRIYEEGGKQWWPLEMALSLSDLQMPAPNKVGDKVDLLLTADLDKLGVNVPKLWTAYTQCLGGELDPATGAVTVKGLQPGEQRLLFVDTFAQ
jgi:hypothetical protein